MARRARQLQAARFAVSAIRFRDPLRRDYSLSDDPIDLQDFETYAVALSSEAKTGSYSYTWYSLALTTRRLRGFLRQCPSVAWPRGRQAVAPRRGSTL